MKSTEFCHWLNGMFELSNPTTINQHQTGLIKKHLEMVFAYEDRPLPFCSFLKGYLTISKPEQIGVEETQLIRDYLTNALGNTVEPPKTTIKTERNPTLQKMC